jgi:hypothetical protein
MQQIARRGTLELISAQFRFNDTRCIAGIVGVFA